MSRLVALCLAAGIALLLITVVPAWWAATMSFFESLSTRQQFWLRIGMLVTSLVMSGFGGWWRSRLRRAA